MKSKQQKYKQKLINYYGFYDCDFIMQDDVIYTISKDNYFEKAQDVLEEIELTNKEKHETLQDY